ncbi:Uma2 family endonuclease [Pueribacillus sp. YX66]|uniref:Uma2 family endonuclease n=1 Tax=Pueribacillus sp. YX66 TaxID=3229242 RepID=UPI00358D9F3A
MEGTPNLVVEILSPPTLKCDKIDKLKTYATYQINEYWITEPEQGRLEQYLLKLARHELANMCRFYYINVAFMYFFYDGIHYKKHSRIKRLMT